MLLYGAAGGVGQIMARWAKHLGAYVIGVVSEGKEDVARAAGCDAVLVWGAVDLPTEVVKLTDGRRMSSMIRSDARPLKHHSTVSDLGHAGVVRHRFRASTAGRAGNAQQKGF